MNAAVYADFFFFGSMSRSRAESAEESSAEILPSISRERPISFRAGSGAAVRSIFHRICTMLIQNKPYSAPRSGNVFYSRRGLGAAGSTSGIISATGSAAGSTLITLSAPALLALGPVGVAIGAGVVLVSQVLGVLGVGNGCGQTCITASSNANQIEAAMQANLAAFLAGEVDQATALAKFDSYWNTHVQMCHQVGGDQATNCVADRQAAACKWRDASGACWNWFVGYRDPIANAAAPVTTPTLGSLLSGSTLELLILAALGIGLVEAAS